MTHLTLIVTCTDRKTLAPHRQTTARELPDGPISHRCAWWRERLESAPVSASLQSLYKGESWCQSLALREELAARKPLRALVASAGVGLQGVDSRHPAYAATFSQGHEDTVCPTVDTPTWWRELRSLQGSVDLRQLTGTVMAVLSVAYARALHPDLLELAQKSNVELLVVGGWRDIPGATRVPADRALRAELGGTVSGLLPRIARRYIALADSAPLTSPEALRAWHEWRKSVRMVETYDRSPLTDQEVQAFIESMRREEPTISATRALRALREAGYACEQKRFGRLFAMAQEAA